MSKVKYTVEIVGEIPPGWPFDDIDLREGLEESIVGDLAHIVSAKVVSVSEGE